MNSKLGKVALLAVVSSIALAGCASSADSGGDAAAECTPAHPGLTTVAPGTLTVAAYEYPPFAGVDGENLTGAEGEILTAIAALECLTVTPQPGAAAAMIPSIETGRADTTMGSWYRTAERAKIVLLSDPVILDQLSLVSVDGVDSIKGLEGKKVGSTLGFLWNDDLQKVLGDDLSLYENTQSMYADLANGRISVIVDTTPSANSALKNTPIDGVQIKVPAADDRVVATSKPGQTNFPVNLNNQGLVDAINANLATLRDNGTLAKIAEKWGFSPSAIEKTAPTLL